MSVKNLTLSCLFLLLLTGCGRGPRVRHYMEVTQAPPTPPPPSAPALPDHHPLRETLPEEHPLLGGMRAGPLTVEAIPENLPPNHSTLSMGQPSPEAAPGASAPAQATRMAGREGEVPPPPSARDLAWLVPEGWRQQPGGGMRLAAFGIDGDESGAITTLVVLGEAAGGVEANIQRWRGELELPPQAPAPSPTVEGRMNFVFVNLVPEAAAAGRESATVGAIYDLGDRTAFLKFMGRPEVLDRHMLDFLRLAGSLHRVENAE